MKAILTRGNVNILTGETSKKFSIKVTTCHTMFKHLIDIRDFLIDISYDWRDYAEGAYGSEDEIANMRSHFQQEYPLPFKLRFNPNLMGHECSMHLTDFLIDENHRIVGKIIDFIREQARK